MWYLVPAVHQQDLEGTTAGDMDIVIHGKKTHKLSSSSTSSKWLLGQLLFSVFAPLFACLSDGASERKPKRSVTDMLT